MFTVRSAYNTGTNHEQCHWSKLDGNGTISWSDAQLTETGIEQAEFTRDAWAAQMKDSVPLPETYYVSPLDRCLATANVTFGKLPLAEEKPFIPTVKEVCITEIPLRPQP